MAVLAGLLALVILALAGIQTAQAAAPEIDLNNPTAAVQDPVAALGPVDTECAAGQVDLNLASPQELAAALDVPSSPTVDRLVEMRPWLKGADLSSVPGIGPQRAAALAGRTCATQPVLPVPTPLACTSAWQVDLQALSAATISTKLRIPRNTAEAIVAARPLSQDLEQVITPRIPGFNKALLDRLLNSEAICVTPAPMLAGGAAWRWATETGGATVSRDGFALIVPPGRVSDPVGAYISVEKIRNEYAPRMDAKIHGTWNSGVTRVAVQGPWIGVDDERPAVLHYSHDRGLALSLGSGTAVSRGLTSQTVTALASSLSEHEFGTTTCQGSAPAPGGPAPLCLSDLTDGSVNKAWMDQALRSGQASREQLTPRSFCGTLITSQSIATTAGGLPWGMSCTPDITDAAAARVTWTNRNDAYGQVLWGVASAGVVYSYSVGGADHSTRIAGTPEGNWFVAKLLKEWAPAGLLFPGQTLEITKRPSFLSTRVDAVADSASTGTWKSIATLVGAAAEMAGPAWETLNRGGNLFEACVNLRGDSFLGCAKTILEGVLQQDLDEADPATAHARKLRYALAVVKAVDLTGLVASLGIGLASDVFSQNTAAIYANQPKRPTTDARGRRVLDGCLSHDSHSWAIDERCQDNVYGSVNRVPPGSSYIARDPSTRRSVLVKPGGTVADIDSGGVFVCLAKTMFVFDNASLPALDAPVAGRATCGDAGPTEWDFRPAREGGNIPDNVILREDPRDATDGVIASWLINNRGEIQTIPSGGVYLCLGYTHPVIWNTPYGFPPLIVGIQWWTPVGTAPASCA